MAECRRAKSDMTPCWLKDGPVTEVEIYGEPACVGCERPISKLKADAALTDTGEADDE